MSIRWMAFALAAVGLASAAYAGTSDEFDPQALTRIIPGHTTKAEIEGLLGTPWRVVQFDDCGQAIAGQSDETWEYRSKGPDGGYRVHIEFDEHGVVHLIADIPDKTGEATAIAVTVPAMCLSM
jgi:hypothetical protein